MQLEDLIRTEGYRNIKCTWYWNYKYNFSRDLRPINCDGNVLKFSKDVKGFDLVDVCVEHSIEVIYESEIIHDYDEEHGLNSDDDEADTDVKVDDNKNSGDDDDCVGSDGKLGNLSDTDYEFSEEVIDLDWTTVLPCENLVDGARHFDEDADSDVLHTPPDSGSDEEHVKFLAYKSGEEFKFQLGMIFSNKHMMMDALKDYAMNMKRNVVLKKNDVKWTVIKCMEGYKFYMRVSKRVGNQFWQVVV
ncbi:hypothetical protein KIW84_033381 [Lathyrus oleraceus]|uniref:Transposase MuDR plant domain-containing protein n=1 Tax=Pisum sativum TaxID=3888 RepID=A0A9D4XWH0_PEA|nr:hypothetical protein KIW84_033381 [Pisum sativum]